MDEVKESPFVENLVAKGYEVIYFTDPLDEYMMQVCRGRGEKDGGMGIAEEPLGIKWWCCACCQGAV